MLHFVERFEDVLGEPVIAGHKRRRIEEAFKRLRHRLNLEHVSGLSQQAALFDFAAKIVCDNLQSLATETALREVALPPTRRVNRAAAHAIPQPLLPALLLGAEIATRLRDAPRLIAGGTYSHRRWHHQIKTTGST